MRYFTVKEANAFIPALQATFGRIEKLRLLVVRLAQDLERLGDRPNFQTSEVPDDLSEPIKIRRRKIVRALSEIRRLVAELEAHGLVVKQLDGLVDFRSLRAQRPVFLCWRRGEDQIDHWHELGSDDARQPVESRLFKPPLPN